MLQAWMDRWHQVSLHVTRLWDDAVLIWMAGGWAMVAIAGVSLVLFGLGTHLYLTLWSKGFRMVREKTWRRWLEHPQERRGPIGRLLDTAMRGQSIEDVVASFSQIRATELPGIERDLRVMKICVGLAPLLGLLGTVTGMLATFDALASGSGGDKTMALIAEGISEALITTETGLVIALPGLFFQYQMSRTTERYKAFLAHVEAVCTQARYRSLQQGRRVATAA